MSLRPSHIRFARVLCSSSSMPASASASAAHSASTLSSSSSLRMAMSRKASLDTIGASSSRYPRTGSTMSQPSIARRWASSSSSSSSSTDSASATSTQSDPEPEPESHRIEAPAEGAKSQRLAQIEPRLQMTFTCTANDCGHRSTHEFSKRSYQKGIVLVQCPECKARHLIADHLGWFKESLEDGKLKTVEDLLAAKGEKIRKGRVNFDGDIEYDGE